LDLIALLPIESTEEMIDRDAISDALDHLATGIKMLASAVRSSSLQSPAGNPAQPAERSLLTPAQLASELHVSKQTLAKWRLSGDGPRYRKLGGAVRYDRAEVEEWVEARRRSHTSDRQSRARR
jgi:excisionase family DNA binding protein